MGTKELLIDNMRDYLYSESCQNIKKHQKEFIYRTFNTAVYDKKVRMSLRIGNFVNVSIDHLSLKYGLTKSHILRDLLIMSLRNSASFYLYYERYLDILNEARQKKYDFIFSGFKRTVVLSISVSKYMKDLLQNLVSYNKEESINYSDLVSAVYLNFLLFLVFIDNEITNLPYDIYSEIKKHKIDLPSSGYKIINRNDKYLVTNKFRKSDNTNLKIDTLFILNNLDRFLLSVPSSRIDIYLYEDLYTYFKNYVPSN